MPQSNDTETLICLTAYRAGREPRTGAMSDRQRYAVIDEEGHPVSAPIRFDEQPIELDASNETAWCSALRSLREFDALVGGLFTGPDVENVAPVSFAQDGTARAQEADIEVLATRRHGETLIVMRVRRV